MHLFMYRPQDCDHNLNYILYQLRFRTKPKRMQPLIGELHRSLDKNMSTEADFERGNMAGRDLSTLRKRREEIQKNMEVDWSISKLSDSDYSESQIQRELDQIIRQKQIQKMTEKIVVNRNHRRVIEPDIFAYNSKSQTEQPLSNYEDNSQKGQIKINRQGVNLPNGVIRGNLFEQDEDYNQNECDQLQWERAVGKLKNKEQLVGGRLNKYDKCLNNTKSDLRNKTNQSQNVLFDQNEKFIKNKILHLQELEEQRKRDVQYHERHQFMEFMNRQPNQQNLKNNQFVHNGRDSNIVGGIKLIPQKDLQDQFKQLSQQEWNQLQQQFPDQLCQKHQIKRQSLEGKHQNNIQNILKVQTQQTNQNKFKNIDNNNGDKIVNNIDDETSTKRTNQQANYIQQKHQIKYYPQIHNTDQSNKLPQQNIFNNQSKRQTSQTTQHNLLQQVIKAIQIKSNLHFLGNFNEKGQPNTEQLQNVSYKSKYKSIEAKKRKNSNELSNSRKNSTKKDQQIKVQASKQDLKEKWSYSNSLSFTQNQKLAKFSNKNSQYPSFQKSLELYQYSKQFDKMLQKSECIIDEDKNKQKQKTQLQQFVKDAQIDDSKLQTNVSPNQKDEGKSQLNNFRKEIQHQKIGLFANKQRQGVSYKRNFKYQKEQKGRSFLKKPNNKIILQQVHKSIQKFNKNEKARADAEKKENSVKKQSNVNNKKQQIQIKDQNQAFNNNTNEISSQQNQLSQMARRANSLNTKIENKQDSVNNNQHAQSMINMGSNDPNYEANHEAKQTSHIKYKSISAIKSEEDQTLLKLMGGSDRLKQVQSFAFDSKPSEFMRLENEEVRKNSFENKNHNNKQSIDSNFSLTEPEIASLYSSTFRLERNTQSDFNLEDALKQQIKKYNSFKQFMQMTPVNSNNHSKDFVENQEDSYPPLFQQNDQQEQQQYEPKFTSYKKFGDYKPQKQFQMAVIDELQSNKVMSSNTSKALVVFESIEDYKGHFHPRDQALMRLKASKGGSVDSRAKGQREYRSNLSLSPMKRLGYEMGSLERIRSRKQKNLGRFKTRLTNY